VASPAFTQDLQALPAFPPILFLKVFQYPHIMER
jgi:hypothetical protein